EYPRRSQNPFRLRSRKSILRIHLTPFQAYNRGVIIRHGPPCSRGSGFPSHVCTSRTSSSIARASGKLVVYDSPDVMSLSYPVHRTHASFSFGTASSAMVLNFTPRQRLSNLLHVVTQ